MTEEEILHQDQEVVPFKLKTIRDDEYWSRYAYELGDGTIIIAKSVDEMPNLSLEGSTFVLTPEEKPNSLTTEEYDTWVRTSTSDHLEESQNIIVNNSPLGAIDLALLLIKKGEAKNDNIEQLIKLRDKVANEEADEQVYGLYDSFMDAGFDVSEKYQEYHHDGLMLLALSLCGDENSISELQTRHNNLTEYIRESIGNGLEPGTKLSEDQLELIAAEHLVAVHTSFTELMDDGSIAILSRSSHDRNNIRATIHWSLNHPVVTHMLGNFANRNTTIVSRLETLARDNGSPAVLYGVDTYFTLSPKQKLEISDDPEEAVIITFRNGKDLPVYEYKQNNLVINPDKLRGQDLEDLLDAISGDNFNARYILENKIFYDNQFKSKQDVSPYDGPLSKIIKDKISNGIDIQSSINEIIESLIDGTIKLDDYPSYIYEEKESSKSYRVPSLKEEIQELIRLTTVDSLISKFNGQKVQSDGTSAYIETEGFDNRVSKLANILGIRQGLHVNQPESMVEDTFGIEDRTTFSTALRAPIGARRNRARKGVPVKRKYNKGALDISLA